MQDANNQSDEGRRQKARPVKTKSLTKGIGQVKKFQKQYLHPMPLNYYLYLFFIYFSLQITRNTYRQTSKDYEKYVNINAKTLNRITNIHFPFPNSTNNHYICNIKTHFNYVDCDTDKKQQCGGTDNDTFCDDAINRAEPSHRQPQH